MQYGVNFSVDGFTILQYGEKMQNIKKCNLQCAHMQAQQNAPE